MMFRHFRRTHRMTQVQLGLCLGCTTRHIKHVEAGSRIPSSLLIERFKELVRLHEKEDQEYIRRYEEAYARIRGEKNLPPHR